jgi:CDP-diacylglycerol--glycerol-3-phosphate 3-phosphatidyltransferase
MLLHIFYAWLIANGYMTAAGIMILVFVPLDALDGALARKIGSTGSKFGAFLASTSDRIAEIILFAGYIYYFGMQDEPWLVAASYVAITGSIMVSYARSRAEALGISCKVGLFSRVERYVLIVATLVLSIPEWGVVILAVGSCFTVGQRVYHVWNQSNLLAVSQESDT